MNALPQNTESESKLLAYLLSFPADDNESRLILEKLLPEDFYSTKHQKIFSAIHKLNGTPARIENVLDKLEESGDLENIGVSIFLNQLLDEEAVSVNVKKDIQNVKDAAARRKICNVCNDLSKDARNRDSAVYESVSHARDEIAKLENSIISGTTQDKSYYDHINGTDAASLIKIKFADPAWIVPNLVAEGISIIAGKPKMGKTVIATNLALSVSLGGKFLGINVERRNSLYMHLEDTPRRMQSRLKPMLPMDEYSGVFVEAPENLHLYDKWPRIGEGGIRALEEFIQQNDTQMVIIDTMKMFQQQLTRKDAQKVRYEIDYDRIVPLRKLLDKYPGLSIILIMHTRKAGSDDPIDLISGTLGNAAAVDNILIMHGRMGARAQLHVRGRDIEQQDYTIEYSPEIWTWNMIGESSDVMDTECQQNVLDFMQEHSSKGNPLPLKQIVEGTGIKYVTVSNRVLPKLITAGKVAKVSRGRYYTL